MVVQNTERSAAVVGHPVSPLYRWRRQPIPGLRRPHRASQRQWTDAMCDAVRQVRLDNPMWSRRTIAIVLRREGWDITIATVDRILRRLMRHGEAAPVPQLRRKSATAPRRVRRKHAKRLPKGQTSQAPGEIVQVDTMTFNPGRGRPAIKHFPAVDPASKWTWGQVFRRATAKNAKRFLKAATDEMPFPVKAIQVDGGSEFMAEFEAACEARKLPLYILPPTPLSRVTFHNRIRMLSGKVGARAENHRPGFALAYGSLWAGPVPKISPGTLRSD